MEATPFSLVEPIAIMPLDPVWRKDNLGALLFSAADCCVRSKLKAVHGGGYPTISDAQLTLFHHLRPGGMRLTALAAEANLTKQSMIELVDRATSLGLVERCPDPNDKRAKTVHLTPNAADFIAVLRRGILDAERDVREIFGATFYMEVKHKLGAYAVEVDPSPIPSDGLDEDAWRLQNVGRLFAMAARRFSGEALDVAHRRGWQSVTEVSLGLFRNLALEGSRLTDIANAARVTKQSMREQVDRAEALFLVRRCPDTHDRRAKMIVFTPKGLEMLEDVRQGLSKAEQRFIQRTSAEFTASLRRLLKYYTSLSDRNPRRKQCDG